MFKNLKLGTKITAITIIILTIGLLGLFLLVNQQTSRAIEREIEEMLTDAVNTRSELFMVKLDIAGEVFQELAMSNEWRDALLNPEDPEMLDRAYQYLDAAYAKHPEFEGMFIADTTTKQIAHVDRGAVGNSFREGDALIEFQNAIFSTDDVYNI